MFTQEKQDFINAEKWDELVKTDFLTDFNYNRSDWQQYIFDKSLIMNFFINENRYIDHKNYVSNTLSSSFYADDVWNHITERMIQLQLNMDMSVDDWKQWLNSGFALYNVDAIDNSALAFIITTRGKGSNFARAIIDDRTYENLIGHDIRTYHKNTISPSLFDSLTDEELKILGPRLRYNGLMSINFENCEETILLRCVDNINDVPELAKKVGVRISAILSDIPSDQFIEMFQNDMGDPTTDTNIGEWTDYFRNNQDIVLSDELATQIANTYGSRYLGHFIKNLSVEQIEKYADSLNTNSIASRSDIPLSKLEQLKGKRPYDLTGKRFFKEEEISEFPQYFDPSYLSKSARLYITRETFSKMNKAWHRRQRYNRELMDFRTIVNNLENDTISIDALKYLRDKTGASPELVMNTIKNMWVGENWDGDGKKIYKIKNFLKKFSD